MPGMNPDHLQHAWQSQSPRFRVTIDAEILLREVQRNHRSFLRTVFWRDVRELGVAAILVPVWIYLGLRSSLPWTWYLMVPAMFWIVGYLTVDRQRHRRRAAGATSPIREHVQDSLAEIEHQIGLLRSIGWWYLLPLSLPMVALFVQLGWEVRASGWMAVGVTAGLIGVAALVLAYVYRINQQAIQNCLLPRRMELERLLQSLDEEAGVES
jgi:hypothetical protein